MNEALVVQRIRKQVLKANPRAVVLKHRDETTAGVPDLSITAAGKTSWLEVKYLRPGETPSQVRKHFPRRQLQACLRLGQAGECHYLVAYGRAGELRAAVLDVEEAEALALRQDWRGLDHGGEFNEVVRRYVHHFHHDPAKA